VRDVGVTPVERPLELSEGKSTLTDALRTMGPPSRVTSIPHGTALLYEYNQVRENQIGFNVPYSYWKYIKLVFAWAKLKHEARLLVFDSNGVLRSFGNERWDRKLGIGFAIELLVAAKNLVEQTDLKRAAPEHRWGRSLLNPLPVALNSAQSLQDGRFGLEQVVSPEVIGQHTLELIDQTRPAPNYPDE
jgi:hypothetical protein